MWADSKLSVSKMEQDNEEKSLWAKPWTRCIPKLCIAKVLLPLLIPKQESMLFVVFSCTYLCLIKLFSKVKKKLWYIYTVEFYAAESKKELIPFAMA